MAFDIQPRDGIRIFTNESGTISILQEGMGGDDLVDLHPEDALKFIDRLAQVLKEDFSIDAKRTWLGN